MEAGPVDYRALMKKVEQFVEAIERSDDALTTVQNVANSIIAAFRNELGIYGGRIYHREGDDYVVLASLAASEREIVGIRVPRTYPPIEKVLEEGILYMGRDDPALDRIFEQYLGVEEFAAIEVGEEEYILAFNVAPSSEAEDVLFSLGIVRHSLNQKLRRKRWVGTLNEAQRIQASILPRRQPRHGQYDIAGRNLPMEGVGGDFYDFIPITDKILGLAIADVSGHGLPAALQVRDIYTGLRMGMARDLKIVRTVERLNRIIHESTLTSRFVSMFYGELELNGLFIYVNAGHPPPFRICAKDGSIDDLEEGGAVLGPLPEATYERGFLTLHPGDVVCLYTDGIAEASSQGAIGVGEEFGVHRLKEVVRRNMHRPAAEILDAVFSAVDTFERGRPAEDDRTAVVVRYVPKKGDK